MGVGIVVVFVVVVVDVFGVEVVYEVERFVV